MNETALLFRPHPKTAVPHLPRNYEMTFDRPRVRIFESGPEDEYGHLRSEIWFDYGVVDNEQNNFLDAATTVSVNSGGRFFVNLENLGIGQIIIQRNPAVTGTDYFSHDAAINIMVRAIVENQW